MVPSMEGPCRADGKTDDGGGNGSSIPRHHIRTSPSLRGPFLPFFFFPLPIFDHANSTPKTLWQNGFLEKWRKLRMESMESRRQQVKQASSMPGIMAPKTRCFCFYLIYKTTQSEGPFEWHINHKVMRLFGLQRALVAMRAYGV